MLAEARNQKDLLVRYGMADTALDGLQSLLDDFDAAVEEGSEARRSHVGASMELHNVAEEVVQIVAVLGSFNRLRFDGQGELLAEWEQTSSVVSGPTPAPATDVKPAA